MEGWGAGRLTRVKSTSRGHISKLQSQGWVFRYPWFISSTNADCDFVQGTSPRLISESAEHEGPQPGAEARCSCGCE